MKQKLSITQLTSGFMIGMVFTAVGLGMVGLYAQEDMDELNKPMAFNPIAEHQYSTADIREATNIRNSMETGGFSEAQIMEHLHSKFTPIYSNIKNKGDL